jgi:hypothetical protein
MPLNAYLLTAKSWKSKNSKIEKRTSHKSVCYIHFMHRNFALSPVMTPECGTALGGPKIMSLTLENGPRYEPNAPPTTEKYVTYGQQS